MAAVSEQTVTDLSRIPVDLRVEYFIVQIELQYCAGKRLDDGHERVDHRQRIHVRSNTLGVHGDDKPMMPGTRQFNASATQHMRVRKH